MTGDNRKLPSLLGDTPSGHVFTPQESLNSFQSGFDVSTIRTPLNTSIGFLHAEKFDLEKVWAKQSLSKELLEMIAIWSKEVNDLLHRTASGRMVSEWAKKAECKDVMLNSTYSAPFEGIPEFRI